MKRYSRTANLFDYQTMADGESGRYLLPDGSTAASTGVWAITDYIPINGTTFTLVRTSAGNAPAICLYDVNKTYLTGIAYNSNMTVTVSSSNNAKFARFSYLISSANPENLGEAMLVEGSTAPSSYIPYGNTWQTKNPPHYGTSTDTITTLPADIYADGTNATVGLVGNMSQTGTPSPSSPIQPSECGERTGNLWDEDYTNISGTIQYRPIYVGSGNFTLSTTIPYDLSVANIFLLSGDVTSGASTSGNGAWLNHNVTAQSVDGYVTIAYRHYHGTTSPVNCDTMLNSGSTALPYEPGGH